MKRVLILSILIVFVTVSCAGPNKVGWRKPDFRQDQFEKDWKECIDSIDKDLNSEAFGKALEECMIGGYQYQTTQNVVRQTGPSVDGQKRWMKTQDEFEKDRKACIDSIDKTLNSAALGKALEECMSKGGYQYQASQGKEPPSTGMIVLRMAAGIVLISLAAAAVGAVLTLYVLGQMGAGMK